MQGTLVNAMWQARWEGSLREDGYMAGSLFCAPKLLQHFYLAIFQHKIKN